MSWPPPPPRRRSAFSPSPGRGFAGPNPPGNPFAPAPGRPGGTVPPPGSATRPPAFGGPPSGFSGPPPTFGGPPPGWYPPPPPRRRGNPAVAIALAVTGGVVVVVLLAVACVVLLSPAAPVADPRPRSTVGAGSDPTPAATPTPTRGPTPTPTPTATPTPPSSEASSPATTPPPRRGEGVYADYPNLSLNPFYGARFGGWQCRAVADPQAPGSSAAFTRYIDGLVGCLMERYGPVVAEVAGRPMTRPTVQLYSGSASTPCGTSGSAAPFYCTANQTIYLDPTNIGSYDDYVRLGAVTIVAHEFAHHVQYEIGVFAEAYTAQLESVDQTSRRIELQAECFTWSQITLLRAPAFSGQDDAEFGDWVAEDQDSHHGTGESYTYWYTRIRGQGAMALCNTWSAPTSVVR